ncbi:hypothetical protein HUB98_01850 [Paenibacillus barcinonensis]|uniref:Uncharacterized protein n=1 Tax=Paenibacillus barcinonensis TaxID=198119 RepID=A0A2V4WKR6_PAEBA|nr:hypothetical protein [Paenibacillus barcinonensis]PYE48064.1 hypothetical protein DFQ00_110126 [Paenibacillus barcinonensis]QKS55175.1 hypothetical protein HUB98_01850 [Paenibacillus barcinonensis]
MLINVVVGMLIPLLIGAWVLRGHYRFFVIYFPLGVALSSSINSVGFNFFWNILPNTRNQGFAALPMDLGIYPVTGCIMMYMILVRHTRPWPSIVISALLLTLIEWTGKLLGHVIYFNGWNIFWTFWSYFLPLMLAYGYSKLLKIALPEHSHQGSKT